MASYTEERLLAEQRKNEAWLMSQPGVTGTGVGLTADGKVALRIFTHGMTKQGRVAIAARLGDLPIAWEEGEIVPY